MAELLSQHTKPEQRQTEQLAANPPLPHAFKYYIHDSLATFRLQLIGDLRSSNVTELSGTWETAKSTLAGRLLVLDLCQLNSADEDGHRWLVKMREAGATPLPAHYFESGLQELCLPAQRSKACTKLQTMPVLRAFLRSR